MLSAGLFKLVKFAPGFNPSLIEALAVVKLVQGFVAIVEAGTMTSLSLLVGK